MATKKKSAKAAKTVFPKEEGEEGAPDRFIPPDRQDQLNNEPGDRPQLVNVKDLSEGLEIVEDDDETGGTDAGDDNDEPVRFEGADDEPELEQEENEGGSRNRNSRGSRKVRARINRERALRQQQQVRADNAERRARAMEERVAKLERVTDEVKGSSEVKVLEAKIATLTQQLKEAIESGKTAEQLDVTIKLNDAQGDLKLVKRDMESAKRKAIDDEAARKTAATDAGGATADEADAPSADDYIAANSTWWNKPKFARQRLIAISLDNEILGQITAGDLDVEKYSDEHFELLNERIAELYPDLPLHNADGEPYEGAEEEDDVTNRDRDSRGEGRVRNGNGTRRPPVGGQGTRNSGRRSATDADLARQGKVRLDQNDFTQMRLYGLDPAKPEHKKAFAKERMRTILTAERRGGSSQRGAR